jgi:hypothetical protein
MATTTTTREASIVEVVMARSRSRYDREFVRRLVAGYIKNFEGARVRQFVDVLVIKQSIDELRRLDALRPVPR